MLNVKPAEVVIQMGCLRVCHVPGCFVHNSFVMVYAHEGVGLHNMEDMMEDQTGGVQS